MLRSGSSLWENQGVINAVFGVDNLTRTSNDHSIQHDIDQPLASDDNHRLILRDSQGFLGGHIKNLKTVQEFIKRKGAERELKDRLHAICAPMRSSFLTPLGCAARFPFPEVEFTSEEMKYSSRTIPTRLAIQKKFSLAESLADDRAEWECRANKTATETIKVSCEKPLNAVASNRHAWTEVSAKDEYKDTIERLINLPMNSILGVPTKATDPKTQAPTGEGTADSEPPNLEGWLFAAAQRGSLGTNISASIAVGRHKYWGYMFSGMFTGIPLDECIAVIHDDIVNVWNFNDPNHQARLASVVAQRLFADIDNTVKIVGSAVGVATSAPPSAPYVLPAAIAVALASWTYGISQRTPEILRYLMGYVIDLIIVMGCLFALVDSVDWIGYLLRWSISC
ncbi:hypothetical protein BS47DRAFT_1385712 [Hydnum rufescens UP504]|uniref:Uncharacterized protein n=1 Tax=Hydnum rufescens UP504 TaxID=1448309 RepID=A0A9P6AIR5_9AGAM|nr:hypothetical protein BS47DRAFT_1385712 [Hydnum rufescens UP504]